MSPSTATAPSTTIETAAAHIAAPLRPAAAPAAPAAALRSTTRAAERAPLVALRSRRAPVAPPPRIAAVVLAPVRLLVAAIRTAWYVMGVVLRLVPGVAAALTGLAVTGGTFGMFAFIGVPLLAVGLGLISAYLPTNRRR